MRHITSLGLTAVLAMLPVQAAWAQYDGGPPRRGYDDYEDARPAYPKRRARPAPARAVGLNCDAVQQGLSGPQPYSCPLPDPRPLGARCFCDMPIVPFSPAQTVVGRVVP
ncbi:hypothetical protein [uncultured Methylobacterium sp.]|uniref:hypothetical protein n=1 Tax=uncultured Methylobacterium sp. TaxID=157278 RepID=UPI0035CACCB2